MIDTLLPLTLEENPIRLYFIEVVKDGRRSTFKDANEFIKYWQENPTLQLSDLIARHIHGSFVKLNPNDRFAKFLISLHQPEQPVINWVPPVAVSIKVIKPNWFQRILKNLLTFFR
jgi:hypothetical protein